MSKHNDNNNDDNNVNHNNNNDHDDIKREIVSFTSVLTLQIAVEKRYVAKKK